MQTEALVTALRELTLAVPFKPFVVELTNGQTWLIDHPEAIRVENGVAIYVESGKSSTSVTFLFDGHSVFRINQPAKMINPGVIVDPPDEPF
jgi:hypothetical protein